MNEPFSSDEPPFVIFPPFEVFYLISLEFYTHSAIASAEKVAEWVQRFAKGDDQFPPQPALDEVQNILIQGAAISRYFWPVRKKYQKRGEMLRAAFNMTDFSPLKDRNLRNMVEHFDEYLDDYLRMNFAGQYVPDFFGFSPDEYRGPLKLFRAYFVDTGQFEILGEKISIHPILDTIADLHDCLLAAHKNGSRFPQKSPDLDK